MEMSDDQMAERIALAMKPESNLGGQAEIPSVTADDVREEATNGKPTVPPSAPEPSLGGDWGNLWGEEATPPVETPPPAAATEKPKRGKKNQEQATPPAAASNQDPVPFNGSCAEHDPESIGKVLEATLAPLIDAARNQVLEELPDALRAAGVAGAGGVKEQVEALFGPVGKAVEEILKGLVVIHKSVKEIAARPQATGTAAPPAANPQPSSNGLASAEALLIRRMAITLPDKDQVPLDKYVTMISTTAKIPEERVRHAVELMGAVKDGAVNKNNWPTK